MAIDPNLTLQIGHVMMFVVDPERELVRFSCRFCGATSEPVDATLAECPPDFTGLPHVPTCLVITDLLCVPKTERAA